jgi:hypothetical protein
MKARTWSIYSRYEARLKPMTDAHAHANIKEITEHPTVYEVLLHVEDVVFVWKWRSDNDIVVYLRQP